MVITVALARLCRIAGLLGVLLLAGCGWVEIGTPETGADAGPRATRPRLPAPEPRPNAAHLPPVPVEPKRIRVQPGDTIESLAFKHGVSVQAMIEANALGASPALTPGQTLLLPAEPEHVVRQGETLPAIARRYQIDPAVLAAENGLTQPYAVHKGQRLRVPAAAAAPGGAAATASTAAAGSTAIAAHGPAVKRVPAAATAKSADVDDANESEAQTPETQETAALPSVQAVPPAPARSGQGFIWPVKGKVISAFGPKGTGLHNDGINIAARKGAAVRAVENGVVAYVGNELRAFGNLVLIKHADGWVSTYAHAEEILVARGDRVRKGQVIARVGSSGNAREPQLHFELRRGKNAVDPLEYLPRGKA